MPTSPPPARTPRQRAALPGGPVDRWIGPLKRLVPWAAAACLGAVLAMTLAKRPEFSFVLKRDQVVTSKERLRVERATYRGADKQGRPFTVRADEAVQRSSSVPVVAMRDLDAEMRLSSGPARVRAASGDYDMEHDTLTLAGPVTAVQGGYGLNTGRATLDIAAQHLTSDGPVTGRGPLGTFSAARMEADVAGERVVLSGGARLHIARRAAKSG